MAEETATDSQPDGLVEYGKISQAHFEVAGTVASDVVSQMLSVLGVEPDEITGIELEIESLDGSEGTVSLNTSDFDNPVQPARNMLSGLEMTGSGENRVEVELWSGTRDTSDVDEKTETDGKQARLNGTHSKQARAGHEINEWMTMPVKESQKLFADKTWKHRVISVAVILSAFGSSEISSMSICEATDDTVCPFDEISNVSSVLSKLHLHDGYFDRRNEAGAYQYRIGEAAISVVRDRGVPLAIREAIDSEHVNGKTNDIICDIGTTDFEIEKDALDEADKVPVEELEQMISEA